MGEGAVFCTACGQPVPAASAIPVSPVLAPGAPIPSPGAVIHSTPIATPGVYAPAIDAGLIIAPRPYAGFWLRFVAYLIDSVVLLVVTGVVLGICVLGIGVGTIKDAFSNVNSQDPSLPFAIMSLVPGGRARATLAAVVVLCVDGKLGASGDAGEDGARIDRNGPERSPHFVCARDGTLLRKNHHQLHLLVIGYIMAGFTEKKQALHDMIASTLVLRKI